MKYEIKKIKITLDSCILFDYLNSRRSSHKLIRSIIESKKCDLYITESVLKEVKIDQQIKVVQELIDQAVLLVLKEPRMGTIIPTPIPADLSRISQKRDHFIKTHLKKRPGLKKHKIIRDFLIAEAHVRNKNDY